MSLFCKWDENGEECPCYVEGSTDYCGSHNAILRKRERNKGKEKKVYTLPKATKKVKHRSSKRAAQERVYNSILPGWKEGKTCGVKGCLVDCQECHHMRGRIGDLLLDIRFWFPVCHNHHVQITNNPEWALKEGYSLPRLHD